MFSRTSLPQWTRLIYYQDLIYIGINIYIHTILYIIVNTIVTNWVLTIETHLSFNNTCKDQIFAA